MSRIQDLRAAIALPFYAVAIGVVYFVAGIKAARVARRMRREAEQALAQHLENLRAERARAARIAGENEWGIN